MNKALCAIRNKSLDFYTSEKQTCAACISVSLFCTQYDMHAAQGAFSWVFIDGLTLIYECALLTIYSTC